MNLLDRGSRWLTDQMMQNAGTVILYRRDDATIASLSAVKIRREVEVLDDDGIPIRVLIFEFRIDRDEIAGKCLEPRSGDIIEERQQSGDAWLYMVMPTQGRPMSKDMSNDRHYLSIHAKQIAC